MGETDNADLKEIFRQAPFIADLGLELISIVEGECIAALDLEPRHMQQNGFVHAGVQATLADHTAGAAATTLAGDGRHVMTAEFKISLLRAAKGERLICRSKVLKPGNRLSFVESEVFSVSAGVEVLVAKASATMVVLASTRE